jgi:hypothetical protein
VLLGIHFLDTARRQMRAFRGMVTIVLKARATVRFRAASLTAGSGRKRQLTGVGSVTAIAAFVAIGSAKRDGGQGSISSLHRFPSMRSAPMGPTVRRFYGLPEKGLDPHFYSAWPSECTAVQQKFGDSWLLESWDVFDVYPADSITGARPFETTPVYRVYNNRPDANHRYTTSLSIRNSMAQAGWIPEGVRTERGRVLTCRDRDHRTLDLAIAVVARR